MEVSRAYSFRSGSGVSQVSATAHPNYRPDIDGLRAFAVIAVVLFHAFPNEIPGGFVGVDVFFVISGYLITQIILTDLRAGTFSFAQFYTRRIRRIFPALIVVLIASLALGWYWLLPSEMISLGKNAAASALFSANLMLLSEVGYFDIAARLKPLLHIWSLGIEEQFYLAWPIILCAIPRRWIATSIAAFILGSFALNLSLVSSHPAETFYLPFTRAWELLAGAILLQIPKPREGFANELLSLAGFSMLLAAVFLFDRETVFPGWAAAVPVIAAALILMAKGSWLNRVVVSNRVAVGIGLISYPLYLWHWPLLVFFELHKFIRPPTDIERLLIVCLSLFLAWLTFRLVERPIRSSAKPIVKPLLAAMTAVAAISVLPASGYVRPLPEAISQLVAADKVADGQNQCVLADSDTKEIPASCVDRKRPLVLIWGDSTAAALIPGFQKLQESFAFGIAQFTVSSCKPLLVRLPAMTSLCLKRNRGCCSLHQGAVSRHRGAGGLLEQHRHA